MAEHMVTIAIEIRVTDEEWALNYGEAESAEKIGDYVDNVVMDVVRSQIDRVGWGEVVRSTPSVVTVPMPEAGGTHDQYLTDAFIGRTFDPPTVPETGGTRQEYLTDAGEWVRCTVQTVNPDGTHTIELYPLPAFQDYRHNVPKDRIRSV